MKIAHIYARYSLQVQGNGDSLRRQISRAEAYARAQGWIIAAAITDLGVSAFRSRNVTEGALGEFLAAVEAGRIPVGCVLIVESLDRISRNTVVDQFLLLLRIVKAGIELVTLMDEKHFTRESINASPLELIVSLAIMIRAYDESLQKSKRIAAAWRFKRQNAAKRKLTARCPPWLEIHPNRTEFITIKDRAFAVKEMFRLAVAGYSPQMIIAELERKRYEAWGKEKKWTLTKVLDVLQNRAVLGEFQTHKMEAGHRVPDGDVISDYFPTVIDVMDFERAKRALNFSPGARHGDANLFIGLAWDGQSGERMVKRNEYLTNESCDRGGPTHRWAYRAFEQNFLTQLIQLDWNVLPTNSHGPTEVIRLESQIADAKIRLDRAIQKVLAGDLAAKELAKEIRRIDVRITELQSKLDGARKGNSANVASKTTRDAAKAELLQFATAGNTASRLRLRLALHDFIEHIELWPRPNGCPDQVKLLSTIKQANVPLWVGNPLQWPFYRVVFTHGMERWIFCQRSRLQMADLKNNVCQHNEGICVVESS